MVTKHMTKNDVKRALYDLIHSDVQGPPDPRITEEFLTRLGAIDGGGSEPDLSEFLRKDGGDMTGSLTIGGVTALNADGSAQFGGSVAISDGSDAAPSLALSSNGAIGFYSVSTGLGLVGNLFIKGNVSPDNFNLYDVGGPALRQWRDGYFSRNVFAGRFQITGETLTYSASTTLDFSTAGWKSISLTGNITFVSSNLATDREIAVRIVSDGSSRTLTFPAGWVFVGNPMPTSIAANKTAILSLRAFGAVDANVVASYVVQP